jgi:23S rRNA (cytidine1920-2'-O)/16S rRNA (cytidine1409-2'-O)-methyltransferase
VAQEEGVAQRKEKKMRLDALLVERGLVESRSKAKALIMAGAVRRGTEVLDKPGHEYPVDTELAVQEASPFVSRGADKLAGFFKAFPWQVAGKRFLDVGASTGGFTDYLLQAGAEQATCVDVGKGQLHYKLRTDARVVNLEGINARQLQAVRLPHDDYPLIVMDLSFISLRVVLPAVWPRLQPEGLLVALIKPQFEVGKADADRHRGVITDVALRTTTRDTILDFATHSLLGCRLLGCCESPIHGMNGNLEYLAGWTRQRIDLPGAADSP